MTEEFPIDLGGGVSGVVTPAAVRSGRPAMVLLNAGFIHRPGPFRLHVDLARRLSKLGFPVVRLDQPGIGDAPPRNDPDDVRVMTSALDGLAKTLGVDSFIVGGLCSAADFGWKIALADRRVRGLFLLDPVARHGFWFRLGQLRILAGRGLPALPAVFKRLLPGRPPAIVDASRRDWPAPGDERGQLAELLARGVWVFVMFSGGVPSYFTHKKQFNTTFGEAAAHANVRFDFWPHSDHMFMLKRDREQLLDKVCAWCDEAFA
jgi:pimeloyl-ACP methyl ester carboxylesterase